MADYKELIRKAIQALPENNGAARRAVYEKARAALVGQLRGLNPPLAARDITQHRLQLEDCIRQVEQEASEQVIAGLKQNEDFSSHSPAALPPPRPASTRPTASAARPSLTSSASRSSSATSSAGRSSSTSTSRPAPSSPPRPTAVPPARPAAAASTSRPVRSTPTAVPRLTAVPPPKPAVAASAPRGAVGASRSAARAQPAIFPRAVPVPEFEEEDAEPDTIEDIIAAAESDMAEPIEVEPEVDDRDDDIEAEDDTPEPPMFRIEQRPAKKPATPSARGESRPVPAIVARAEAVKAGRGTSSSTASKSESSRRANGADTHRNGSRQQLAARRQENEPIRLPRPSGPAMSSVREVELEGPSEGDAQVAIERAIATLEREARNDGDDDEINGVEEEINDRGPSGRRRSSALDEGFRERSGADAGFARGAAEPERERGGSAVTIFLLVFLVLLVAAGGGSFWAWREGFIDFDAMFGKTPATQQQAAAQPAVTQPETAPAPQPQTNTEAAPNTAAQSAAPLTAAPAPATTAPEPTPAPTPSASAEPSAQTAPKSEERLSQSNDATAAPDTANAGAPAATASAGGSQSLLLEASQDGTTGAVPFSGTVEWSKGTDEMGQPTIVGKANIPARNLGVSVLIRKNADPTLPASHLMEINFSVTDSFIGGAISGLPGVLLKNEELVQGTPLVGASARVVGNSFLFALSSSSADEQTNKDLLTSKKWMDLAIIYATGKKAIITLEKDDKTEQLFNDVFTAWNKEAGPAPAAATKPAAATTTN